MIGLGSNRLTVCRRGGMSVTQAGRGGMEWLAGGRGVSPYSAQATAALKAQFPTQWPTIRDYGFAHPEIVGYMNAYAPEDAKIAYSLVEGIGTRWLVGTGTQWIDTGLYATQNTTAKAKAKLAGTSSSSYQGIFGARITDRNRGFDICLVYPNGIYYDFSNNSTELTLGPLGTEANVEMNKNGGWLNGAKVFDSSTTAFTSPSKVAIFGRTDGGTTNTRPFNGPIAFVEFGGDLNAKFVPFIRNNVKSMLEIVSGTFHPNMGTGTFTELIESPS